MMLSLRNLRRSMIRILSPPRGFLPKISIETIMTSMSKAYGDNFSLKRYHELTVDQPHLLRSVGLLLGVHLRRRVKLRLLHRDSVVDRLHLEGLESL